MSNQFPENPFQPTPGAPVPPRMPPQHGSPNVGGLVLPPAIIMLVAAILGVILAIFGLYAALGPPPPPLDPNAPDWLKQLQQQTQGSSTAITQGLFIVMNLAIIVCAIMMIRMKSWGASLTGSILSIINIGNCCCILGLPVGIWGIIVLTQPKVKDAFHRAA